MSLNLDALGAFLKVAELGSFTKASAQLSLSTPRVSVLVKDLESDLGTRLLQRTTRAVTLTAEGEQLRARAASLMRDAEAITTLFQAPSGLRGRLRVDLPVNLARDRIIPRLPEFFAAHPNLELQLSTTDRRVDVLREGFDCVLRVGRLESSTLVVKRLGELPMVNVVSAAYAARHGVPRGLDDLEHHHVVHYASRLDGERPGFEWVEAGRVREVPMRALVTVNSVDAYHAACVAGLGLIQAPRLALVTALANGAMLEVLPQHRPPALPVAIVHGFGRAVPQRVRVFIAWLSTVLAPHVH